MEFLPYEILERILMSTELTVKDVVYFKSTCSRFYKLWSNNNFFWRQKYHAQWPNCARMLGDNFNKWYEELCYAYKVTECEKLLLAKMSSKFYKKSVIFDCELEDWIKLCDRSPRTYQYLIIDLMKILRDTAVIKTIEVVSLCTPGNFTLKHYAAKALIFLTHWYLRTKWELVLHSCELFHTLEQAAIFVVEWFQPTMDIKKELIAKQLDDLANQVKSELEIINPSHRLHKISQRMFVKWKSLNVEEDLWSMSESKQIISCVVNVLQNKNRFHENYNGSLSDNYFINKVLDNRTGMQIIICIIYQSIARRLGVKCIPVGFSSYFLLKVFDCSDDDYYYVDIFRNGSFISKNGCVCQNDNNQTIDILGSNQIPYTFRKFSTWIGDILYMRFYQSRHSYDITKVRIALEFQRLMRPADVDIINNVKTLYANYSRNQSLSNNVSLKQRPADLKYAVGMVMKHRRMNYLCVIYDWDPSYIKGTLQPEIGIYKLQRRDQQPFYKVLVDDDLQYYVAEDDLMPEQNPRMLINNTDVGRHFSHFYVTHYVPNEEKEKQFPTDYQIRWKFHHAHFYNV